MPTLCVDKWGQLTDNDGMSLNDADISGADSRDPEPLDRLRDAKLGAFFRPSQVEEAGLTRDHLRALVRRGLVEHTQRGLYRLVEAEVTETYSLAMACARVPNCVVCLLSALRFYEIGTQSPPDVWLAIPHKAREPRLEGLRLKVVRFSGPAWTFGVKATEFEGVPAKITTPARTIVDCFRFERLMGPEAAMEALIDGLGQKMVTVADLGRMEGMFPSRRLRAALDMRSI